MRRRHPTTPRRPDPAQSAGTAPRTRLADRLTPAALESLLQLIEQWQEAGPARQQLASWLEDYLKRG